MLATHKILEGKIELIRSSLIQLTIIGTDIKLSMIFIIIMIWKFISPPYPHKKVFSYSGGKKEYYLVCFSETRNSCIGTVRCSPLRMWTASRKEEEENRVKENQGGVWSTERWKVGTKESWRPSCDGVPGGRKYPTMSRTGLNKPNLTRPTTQPFLPRAIKYEN